MRNFEIKGGMLDRDNYSYKKYQKELARKKKAEQKAQRKLKKKVMEATPDTGQDFNGHISLE